MFKWARNKELTDPIPVPSDAQGVDGTGGWAVFTQFGREVFALAHAEDQDMFEGALADFRKSPQRVRRTREFDPAVGTGVALFSAIPYLLPVVSLLLGVVAERASNSAIDLIESTTRRKLARLLESRRQDTPDPDTSEPGTSEPAMSEPVSAEPVTSDELTPGRAVVPPRDHAARTAAHDGPERLGADEERELHAVLMGWGVGMRMEAAAAGHLADAVIEALRQRGSEGR